MAIKVGSFVYGTDYSDSSNYVELPDYVCLKHYTYEAYSSIEHTTFDTNSEDGLVYAGTLYKERTFSLPLVIYPYLNLNIKQTIRKFEDEFLSYIRKNGVLIFNDEDDIMYNVYLTGLSVDTFYESGTSAVLELSCFYPFGMDVTPTISESSYGDSSINLYNGGTHQTYSIIEVTAGGTLAVARPKIYNLENQQFLGYNATIGNGFSQTVEFNCFEKTVTYSGMDRSAYFMQRGNFFPLEPVGENEILISADSGLSSLKVKSTSYDIYLI